jgi:hypothetical protein
VTDVDRALLKAQKDAMTDAEKLASGAFFASLAIGLGGALAYETYAILSGKTPTISKIAAGEIAVHPHRGMVIAFVAGGAVTGLVAHFADLIRVWRP